MEIILNIAYFFVLFTEVFLSNWCLGICIIKRLVLYSRLYIFSHIVAFWFHLWRLMDGRSILMEWNTSICSFKTVVLNIWTHLPENVLEIQIYVQIKPSRWFWCMVEFDHWHKICRPVITLPMCTFENMCSERLGDST